MLTRSMGVGERAALRAAVLHLERYRAVIEAEVDRRMGREEPPPEVRGEIVRRFRTFCRLASLDVGAARPSLDGLGGNSPGALEQVLARAVEVALECSPPLEVASALVSVQARFSAGMRRIMSPREPDRRRRRGRRKVPNAGRRVRAAIDRIGDAYIALNLDTGLIFDVNPAAETLFGSEAEHLLRRPLAELVAPGDRQTFADLESRLDAGEDAGPLELSFARRNGDFVRVETLVSQHTIAGKRLAIFTSRERLKEIA